MSSQRDITALVQEIRQSFAFLDRDLQRLIRLEAAPIYHSTVRPNLADHTKWYPINVPANMKYWKIQAIPGTSTFTYVIGETDNLQEQPPTGKYFSVPANTKVEEFTSPKIIFIQASADNTVIEMERWI